MAIQSFDELNSTYREYAEKWFDKMEIPDKDKKKRVDLTLDFCEILIMMLGMFDEDVPVETIRQFSNERLTIIAENYIGQDDIAFVNDWAEKETDNIIKTTEKHITEPITEDEPVKEINFEDFGVSIPENEYWTSPFRAFLLGIESATACANYGELYEALNRGKTRKVWVTEGDERVRPTHVEVDGTDIPITDLFQVGNSLLMFPGDISNGAEPQETSNCRCRSVYY